MPEWAKIVSCIGGVLVLLVVVMLASTAQDKNPLAGKWETDYEHYEGLADEEGIHLTFSSGGKFVLNKIAGDYTTSNGLLTLYFEDAADEPLMYEYKVTNNTLILDGTVYFIKVKEFIKPINND